MPSLKTRVEFNMREVQAVALSDSVAALSGVAGSSGQFPYFTSPSEFDLAEFGVGSADSVPTRADADGRYVLQGAGANWVAATGTEARTTFAAYSGQTVSVGYVQAEAQATDNAIKAVSQRLAALVNDLVGNGTLPTA